MRGYLLSDIGLVTLAGPAQIWRTMCTPQRPVWDGLPGRRVYVYLEPHPDHPKVGCCHAPCQPVQHHSPVAPVLAAHFHRFTHNKLGARHAAYPILASMARLTRSRTPSK